MVQDYERSFIGAFASSILRNYLGTEDSQFELYFTIAKFEGNMGYSLTQNYDEIDVTMLAADPDDVFSADQTK